MSDEPEPTDLVPTPPVVYPDVIHVDRGPRFLHMDWEGKAIDGCDRYRIFRPRTAEDDEITDV